MKLRNKAEWVDAVEMTNKIEKNIEKIADKEARKTWAKIVRENRIEEGFAALELHALGELTADEAGIEILRIA